MSIKRSQNGSGEKSPDDFQGWETRAKFSLLVLLAFISGKLLSD